MIGTTGPEALDGRQEVPSRPWAAVPSAVLSGVAGVMTDIDDTLTRDGAIELETIEGAEPSLHLVMRDYGGLSVFVLHPGEVARQPSSPCRIA